jgi:hypothetical protein
MLAPDVTAWPTAGAIVYGQMLASSVLSNGAATVEGSFAFTTPASAPDAGTALQSVTFTPADAMAYAPVTGTVSVTVRPAIATVTLGNLSQSGDGAAKAVSVTTDPANLTVVVTYDGNAAAPTEVGQYTVIGTVVEANYSGGATSVLVIGQATVILDIQSPHGLGTPAVGLYTNTMGSVLTNRMANPEPAGGTQYVCTGWSMTGNDPASGTNTQFVMTATNSAALTWLWATNSLAVKGTPLWWLAQHGLTNDFEAASTNDTDRDGITDAGEYVAGTDPTNSASRLGITRFAVTRGGAAQALTWSSMAGRVYGVECSTDPLNNFVLLPGATSLPATPPVNVYTNTSAAEMPVLFYRVRVWLAP